MNRCQFKAGKFQYRSSPPPHHPWATAWRRGVAEGSGPATAHPIVMPDDSGTRRDRTPADEDAGTILCQNILGINKMGTSYTQNNKLLRNILLRGIFYK